MNFIQYITKKSIILDHKKSCYVFRFSFFLFLYQNGKLAIFILSSMEVEHHFV